MSNKLENKPLCISIIIPAFNEENYISYCLESIAKLNNVSLDKEIIVVDNGSSDNTREISKSYNAKVLLKKEGTIGSLRNYGAKTSKGDFIAFLDADCVVPVDWLGKASKYLNEENRAILGFRLSIPKNSNWVAQSWDLLFAKRNVTSEVDWIPSGNMIMTREAFSLINGFDETLESNEDYDFCFRVKNQGYKLISCSETSVVHLRPPDSLTQLFRKELWHGKEVFKVFISDLIQSKDLNITRKKNSKIVLFALYNLALIFAFLLSLVLAFSNKMLLPVIIALALPIISSFLLALRYTRSHKDKKMLIGMTILLMVYGLSRALSILPYEKLKKFKKSGFKF